MRLSPQEDALLKELQAQEQDHTDQQKGAQAVDQVDSQRVRLPAPNDPPRPFSVTRTVVGGLRDAAQGVFNAVDDAGDWLEQRIPLPVLNFGSAASNGYFSVHFGDQAVADTKHFGPVTLPEPAGSEQAGGPERFARALVSFAAPFGLFSRSFGIAKAASWLGRAGIAMTAGATTDFTTLDPQAANLANAIKDTFGIDNEFLNELSTEPDDNRLEARFKAAAVNAPVSVLSDAVMEAGLRGVRAYRAWRGTLDEANAAVEAATRKLPVYMPPSEEGSAAARADAEAGGASAAEPAQAAPKAAPEAASVAPRMEQPAETPEDILDFLKRKVSEGATDEDIQNLAKVIAEGDPENAAAHLGVDPLKMDWSSVDNPEMLGALSRGIQGVYEAIAQRLGRTGITVTEAMTAGAARTLASTADVLKQLYGHTQNLDAIFYASRLIVGSHAQKLVSQAQRALDAIRLNDGTAADEWIKFLQDFERHAYFLGALRGAGSEVGRALRQLQHVAKVGKATAAADLKDAAEESAKKNVGPEAAKALATDAADEVGKMTTDAEKMAFLGRLIDKGGDIGDLSRFVRAKSGSRLQNFRSWLDEALGETRGNLFSAATAEGNVIAGFTLMGLRGLAKTLVTVGRMGTAPFSSELSRAAQVQAMETWAYVEGGFTGWRSAWSNLWYALKQEGMEEVALNALGVGADKIAARAQAVAETARQEVHGDFTRVELNAQTRKLALTPAMTRELDDMIESWDTPALLEHSMKWGLRAIRPALNAYGSLSRLGTILFLNGPDEFLGTMAAKAGAQERAVQIAAAEAAKLDLQGAELRQYLKARMIQLTETADGFGQDAYSAGQQQAVLSAGTAEANAALYKDQLETVALRGLVHAAGNTPFLHIFVPFVKTPLRILERTLIDYTPLGFFKDRIRQELLAGGTRRDEMLARIGLGTMAVYTAFQLAEDRGIVGNDGGYQSSSRVMRPSYSLKVGDDVIEFKRFDPLGTLLGWGADMRAILDAEKDKAPGDRGSKSEQLLEASIVAATWNVLNKTWLTSLQQIVDLASDTKDDPTGAWARYLQSFAQRFVPAAGAQKNVLAGMTDSMRKSAGFIDGMMSQTFAGTRLPQKRDFLGRVIHESTGQKVAGLNFGPESADPLNQELDRLSFNANTPPMSYMGVKLNPVQYERLLELRGQVVKDPKSGLTMEQSLRQLIASPVYGQLPKLAKIEQFRRIMEPYGRLAGAQLMREDKDLMRQALSENVYNKMVIRGYSQQQIDEQTQEFARQLGLSP
jgi:hypothetical protein